MLTRAAKGGTIPVTADEEGRERPRAALLWWFPPVVLLAALAGLAATVVQSPEPVPLGPYLLFGPRTGEIVVAGPGAGPLGPPMTPYFRVAAPWEPSHAKVVLGMILVRPTGWSTADRRRLPGVLATRMWQWPGLTIVQQ